MGGSHERSGSDALIERVPGNGTYPTSPVVELLDWLSHLAAHAGLGVAIGLLAARLMRRAHLHWSWAAGCVACEALAAQPVGGGLTSPGHRAGRRSGDPRSAQARAIGSHSLGRVSPCASPAPATGSGCMVPR